MESGLEFLGFMSIENYIPNLKSAIARIYNKNSKVIGAGFLVSQYHLLTCAHVVTAALGIPTNTQTSPDATIELDFPLIAPGKKVTAKVIFWQPVNPGQSKEDIAGLQIDETLPVEISPVKLITSSNYWQHKFRIFGFPQGHDAGVWADGELRDIQGTGLVQVEAIKVPGYQIEPGFSGSPVWDESLNGVVGMAVSAEKKREGVKAAFMIPTTVLVAAWSFLQQFVQEQSTPASNSRQDFWTKRIASKEEELAKVEADLEEAPTQDIELKLSRKAERLLEEIEQLKNKHNKK